MIIEAKAKINLSLDVLGKRADGYHELRSIMAETGLKDILTIEKAKDIRVECDLPLPVDNTAYRAAALFMQKCGGGAHIYIEKHIPSEAGMGGASADAAAVLRALQALYGEPLSELELYALGKAVGADVPFCLHGGFALCEGIGEKLTALPPLHAPVLLIKGERGVSTAALFRGLKLPLEHPDTAAMISALERGDIGALAAKLFNALETPAAALLPEIRSRKEKLMQNGALGACMTGSGSCVFGLFESKEKALCALDAFKGEAFAFLSAI